MKTIYKYTLTTHEKQIVPMPKDALILTASDQGSEVCVWVEVETENGLYPRMIEVFPTGGEIPTNMGTERTYLGTAKLMGGSLIFHIYERLS